MSALAGNLVVFGRLLRRIGLDVATAEVITALEALAAVGVARRDDVYQALRAVCVRRRDDVPAFDAAFAAFWQDLGERGGRRDLRAIGEPRAGVSLQIDAVLPELDAPPGDHDLPRDGDRPLPDAEVQTWSRSDALREQDFADMTPSELAEARQALEALASKGAEGSHEG